MIHNKPYVKEYRTDENGIQHLVNPITKDNPYLVEPRQFKERNSKNNKKGIRLIVTSYPVQGGGIAYSKYRVITQSVNTDLGHRRISKTVKHYVPA